MKQWMYTTLIVAGSIVLTLLIVASVLGMNPLVFFFNTMVYILAVPGLLFALPFGLGWGTPWLIQRGDDGADDTRNMASGWHYVIASFLSVTAGFLAMNWLIPVVTKIPQLNTWAWEFLRFPPAYETLAWGWFAVVACCYLLGYLLYFVFKDFS